MEYTHTDCPYGRLLLAGDASGLRILELCRPGRTSSLASDWKASRTSFSDVLRQLDRYFTGRLRSFDLVLAPDGTPFQQRVWAALRAIPYGETRSYGEIAATIGSPKASRAVGAANGRNPIAIIIPCHRVIGGSGSLTGYGWGIETKAKLLAFERMTAAGWDVPMPFPARSRGSAERRV
jgi:methylated-DNA-[protein]-cysteine S-methyltransferase